MNTDDTVREGKQAREDVWAAMLEAGLLPGHVHIGMESEADVESMYRRIADENPDLVVYRVPRYLSKLGRVGGVISATTILGMPEVAKGKVALTFDGYASDRRELFEIPKVVEFCRGLLMVSEKQPQQDHAAKVLSMMFDEDAHAFKDGELVERRWLDTAGGLWLCGVAFPEEVYHKDTRSTSGWMRDYGLAFDIRQWLMGGPPPGQTS